MLQPTLTPTSEGLPPSNAYSNALHRLNLNFLGTGLPSLPQRNALLLIRSEHQDGFPFIQIKLAPKLTPSNFYHL